VAPELVPAPVAAVELLVAAGVLDVCAEEELELLPQADRASAAKPVVRRAVHRDRIGAP
jgi:hypothetical protein